MPLTPEVWLDEFTVNTVTSGIQLDPDITQLANGNILVSWTSSANTGAGAPAGLDIIGQLYNSRGETIGGEIILNQTIQGNNESAAKMTALPGGGFAMAYIANDGNGADIEVAVFNASGVEQSRRTVVAGDTALPDYRSPVIAAISDTQALIAYVEDNNSGDDRILVHAYDTSTDTLGIVIEAFDSADFNDGNITNLQIDVLDTGNYIVAGTIEGTGNSVFRVISPISAIVSGSKFGANQTVDTSIAALTGGTFALVAQRALLNGDNFLEITVVGTSGGLSVVGSTLINPSGVQNYNEPDVVALGDGGFIVFWDDDGANTLEGQRFNASGNTVGNQFQLTDTPDAIEIEATLLGDGRVAVTFVASPTAFASNIFQVILDTRDDPNTTPVYTPISQQIGTIGDDTFTVTADEAFGYDGNDTITGSANDDTIFGGDGIDTITGGNGADTIFGGEGNDIIVAGGQDNDDGIDTVFGGAGDDTITGGFFVDILNGEAGNDRFIFNSIPGGSGADFLDTIDGGADTDTVDFSGVVELNGGYTVDLENETYVRSFNVAGGPQSITNVENIIGSQLDDTFTGDGEVNDIQGGAGDDIIEGGAGADVLDGGAGLNDTLSYESSPEGPMPGTFPPIPKGVVVDLAGGAAAVDQAKLVGTHAEGDTYVNFENVIGSAFGDTITGVAGEVNRIEGRDGIDTLFGQGEDQIFGGAGGDALSISLSGTATGTFDGGGDGGDNLALMLSQSSDLRGATVTGFQGFNIGFGGNSVQLLAAQLPTQQLVLDGTGGVGSADIHLDTQTNFDLSSLQIVTFATGTGTIVSLIGNADGNTITGAQTSDRLDGGAGADILAGGAGNDIYIIDNIGDVVNENGSDASDQVFTLVDYDVPDGVELLTQGGTGDLRTNGTDARDIIIGNSGNNTINGAGDGGLGDVMQGGDGNDSYAVDNSNDAVVETATGGNDAIDSLVDFNLAQSPNVETLILRRGSQTAVQAFGDDTDNQLFGNEFVNNLFGAGGTDFLLGFEGSDNFIITPENGAVDVIGDFDFMGDKDRIGISGFGPNAQVVQVSTESFEIRSADGSITQQFILQGYTGGGLVEGADYFFG